MMTWARRKQIDIADQIHQTDQTHPTRDAVVPHADANWNYSNRYIVRPEIISLIVSSLASGHRPLNQLAFKNV